MRRLVGLEAKTCDAAPLDSSVAKETFFHLLRKVAVTERLLF